MASQRIFEAKAAEYFANKTRELIDEKSSKFVNASTKRVDIIKDVINELPVRWMSDTGVVSSWSKCGFYQLMRLRSHRFRRRRKILRMSGGMFSAFVVS